MEKRTLSVVKRTSIGKHALKAVRKDGLIPAVMYGHSENVLFSVDAREFGNKFKVISENTIIDLKDGKKAYQVLIKDFQENVLKGEIIHIDFYEVEKGKTLHTAVPIHAEGTAEGVRLGGSLNIVIHELQVECLPKDIPELFTVNIDALQIGDSLHVSDIAKVKGVKILSSPDQVIVNVAKAVGALETEEEVEEETPIEE
ncbi:MAG: 50S ribosomal protein L25 [Spirochaetaceae bacterium]